MLVLSRPAISLVHCCTACSVRSILHNKNLGIVLSNLLLQKVTDSCWAALLFRLLSLLLPLSKMLPCCEAPARHRLWRGQVAVEAIPAGKDSQEAEHAGQERSNLKLGSVPNSPPAIQLLEGKPVPAWEEPCEWPGGLNIHNDAPALPQRQLGKLSVPQVMPAQLLQPGSTEVLCLLPWTGHRMMDSASFGAQIVPQCAHLALLLQRQFQYIYIVVSEEGGPTGSTAGVLDGWYMLPTTAEQFPEVDPVHQTSRPHHRSLHCE